MEFQTITEYNTAAGRMRINLQKFKNLKTGMKFDSPNDGISPRRIHDDRQRFPLRDVI